MIPVRSGRVLEYSMDRQPKFHALRIVASARARAGDVEGALKSASLIDEDERMTGRFESFGACSEIAQAQAKAGDFAGALRPWNSSPPRTTIS